LRQRTVLIDALPERAGAYGSGYAVVAVDVIRATTTAVTAAATGRRVFPVASLEEARRLASQLPGALLAGEQAGERPADFQLDNSPAAFAARKDVHRPAVLLSSSGTRLVCAAAGADEISVACLRNVSAQVVRLAEAADRVAVLGAGTRGDFRPEDQLCCAWIARGLLDAGFAAADARTEELVERWRGAAVESIRESPSADFLRRTGQLADLEFVLAHVDDLAQTFLVEAGEVVPLGVPAFAAA